MIGPVLKQEIENTFIVVREKCTTLELVFCCPECGDKTGHRSVNLKSGKTFCWKCNKGKNNKGNFVAWARALGFHFTADTGANNVPVEQLLYAEDQQESVVPVIQEVKLPEGFTPIARTPKSVYTKLITKMAARKNLDYAAFAEAGAGYTPAHPKWEPFCIFPVQEYGLTVYYQGRTYVDVPGETTKKFPSRNEVTFGAGNWVYNIDTVREQQPEIVVIVESILNVLSLRKKLRQLGWKNIVPVCVFKHHLSQVQALKLLRCQGVQEFCMLFDHDAIDKTWQSVSAIANKKVVTIAEMPLLDGNKKCDPNDDVDAAINAIENRQLYTASSFSRKMLEADDPRIFSITSRNICS
jgi:hypothetical protein